MLHTLARVLRLRAVASGGGGGGKGGSYPPWICWTRKIKPVDGLVFFRISYFDYSDLQLFAVFIIRGRLFGDISHYKCWNSVSEPPNLKIFRGRTPPGPLTRHVPSAFLVMPRPDWLLFVFKAHWELKQGPNLVTRSLAGFAKKRSGYETIKLLTYHMPIWSVT